MRASVCFLGLLGATTVLLSACSSMQVVHPAAQGLPLSQVAVIATSQTPQRFMMVSLDRVTDEQGSEVASFGISTSNAGNTVVVNPGSYKVKVSCLLGNNASASPATVIQVAAGYTYTVDCVFNAYMGVQAISKATPTQTTK